MELSEETIKAIERAKARLKKGKFLTEAEARMKLHLFKSKLTQKDVEEIGKKIKRGIAKKHGL